MEESSSPEIENEQLVVEIEKMFLRREIQPTTECRIYKVPHHLRKWNEEAYTPQVISIGPYHHKNKKLKTMEENKERYFRSFVQRCQLNWKNLVPKLVSTIRELEERIRGCYAETIELKSDEFVKMILVDASFILELFMKYSSRNWTSDDPMFIIPIASAIRHDLLLLENQLPFFVLNELYLVAFPCLSNTYPFHSSNHVLIELTFKYFSRYNVHCKHARPDVKIEHFTDLLRTFHLPPPEQLPNRDTKLIEHLHSATHLQQAGVKFDVEKRSCLDIKFEKGVLKIPCFKVDDYKEVVIRNIMALEQTRHITSAYISDYYFVLDLLINTERDVELLSDKKIITNYLGDNTAVKSVVNSLNKGITGVNMRADYVDLCKKLDNFYKNPWHNWKATLRRRYFSTPWRTTSTIVAFVLLVLTCIQAVSSIIQVV
ncbi:hypothetical protein ACB098_01G371400 [Castanea mollissima]|uniref:Uncharacterized protein n=1 Tax=Castanea mollissima TaxID=60419 RepID=A0A8J4QIV2_9ROSI|nr:hypothetical protein CMV_024075 [Castanea mollissima]